MYPSVDVDRLITASSLAGQIDARAALARSALAALEARLATLDADSDAARATIDTNLATIEGRGDLGIVGSALAREARIRTDAAAVEATVESTTARRDELARLAAQSLALTRGRDIAVLQELADESAKAASAIAELVSGAAGTAATDAWVWPVSGTVTQVFGPSALVLEPPVVFRGVTVAHFHDAIDIGAPLGSAVVATAAGHVTYVGHLPDGAMIVVIAHDDGLVSLYAHLDDSFAPPRVRAGDRVAAGQLIGYVGLTGITTGPHLHFSVHDASGPVDPLTLLGK